VVLAVPNTKAESPTIASNSIFKLPVVAGDVGEGIGSGSGSLSLSFLQLVNVNAIKAMAVNLNMFFILII
jgi:hypothetical protein